MFRIAAITLFFFTGFWLLTSMQNKLNQRSSILHRLSLESKFELQKKLLRAKERASDLMANNQILTKINRKQTHSLRSLLQGEIKYPEREFLTVLSLRSCKFIAQTKSNLPLKDACALPQSSFYYVKDMVDAENHWVLQVFPLSRLKSKEQYLLVFGSKISIAWLAPDSLAAVEDYNVSLAPPSPDSIADFSKVDPALTSFALVSDDWVAKINRHLNIFTPQLFETGLTFLFIATVIVLALLTHHFRRREFIRANKESAFSNFLRRDLGINFDAKNFIDITEAWLEALRGVDLKAQSTLRAQKKEIAHLKSRLNDISTQLQKSEARNAPLRRFKNIQSQFQKFGEDIMQFFETFFPQNRFELNSRLTSLQGHVQTIDEMLGDWRQGFEMEGERRYLRRLGEQKSTTEANLSRFGEQFSIISSKTTSLQHDLDLTFQALSSVTRSFQNIEHSGRILFAASSEADSHKTTMTYTNLQLMFQDITESNLTYSSDMNLCDGAPFAIQVSENFVYPFTMALTQTAHHLSEDGKRAINVKLKHKLADQTHYIVAMFEIKEDQATDLNQSVDGALHQVESLLEPIGVSCQLIEFNRRRLVISLNWQSQSTQSPNLSNLEAIKTNADRIF